MRLELEVERSGQAKARREGKIKPLRSGEGRPGFVLQPPLSGSSFPYPSFVPLRLSQTHFGDINNFS
jgi:hypothetical protein